MDRPLNLVLPLCLSAVLNFRKNGEPFWNLLHMQPLRNGDGAPVLFMGGQVYTCSAVVHHRTKRLESVVKLYWL